MALENYFKLYEAQEEIGSSTNNSDLLDFFSDLYDQVKDCINHKACHEQLYKYLRDKVIYTSPSAGTKELMVKKKIEENYNLPRYPTSIQLMNFTSKLLSEIPLETNPKIFVSEQYKGRLQSFWCISESIFDTKPFRFEDDSESKKKRCFIYEGGDGPTEILKKHSSLDQALDEIFGSSNEEEAEEQSFGDYQKGWENLCKATCYYNGKSEWYEYAGFVQENKGLSEKLGIKKNKNQFPAFEDKNGKIPYLLDPIVFSFPYFKVGSLSPFEPGFEYDVRPVIDSRNIWEQNDNRQPKNKVEPIESKKFMKNADLSTEFLFTLDQEEIIIENQVVFSYENNPCWTFFDVNVKWAKINFRTKAYELKKIDKNETLKNEQPEEPKFKEFIQTKTPWKIWYGTFTPSIVYVIGNTKKYINDEYKDENENENEKYLKIGKPLPLWMNRPSTSQIPRSEGVDESLYKWKFPDKINVEDTLNDFRGSLQNGVLPKALACLIFGKEADEIIGWKQPDKDQVPAEFQKCNTPQALFVETLRGKDSSGKQNIDQAIEGKWAQKLHQLFNISYYRKIKEISNTRKVVKPFYKQNLSYDELVGDDDNILVSTPRTFSLKHWSNVKSWPRIKNKGQVLGRNYQPRIPDQGTVMKGLIDSLKTNYKEIFKRSKISASKFTELTLEHDNKKSNEEPIGQKKGRDQADHASEDDTFVNDSEEQPLDQNKDGFQPGQGEQLPTKSLLQHWEEIKGCKIEAADGGKLLRTNQEWCHLMGHGDGGTQKMGNLVSGSWFCNSEQLAIEQGLRVTTHNGKISDKYELRTTAYLFPNEVDFFDRPYLAVCQPEEQLVEEEEERPGEEAGKNAVQERKRKYNLTDTGNTITQPNDKSLNNNYGKTMPVCAFIRYKIIKEGVKIFDHVFEGQGEFWDHNQHAILKNFVKYLLAGEEAFKVDLKAKIEEITAAGQQQSQKQPVQAGDG